MQHQKQKRTTVWGGVNPPSVCLHPHQKMSAARKVGDVFFWFFFFFFAKFLMRHTEKIRLYREAETQFGY